MKTRACLKYFAHGCLYNHFYTFNLLQAPSNLIILTIFVTMRSLTQFQPKIKSAKFCPI